MSLKEARGEVLEGVVEEVVPFEEMGCLGAKGVEAKICFVPVGRQQEIISTCKLGWDAGSMATSERDDDEG